MRGEGWILKIAYFLESYQYTETMIGKVVTSKVDVLMYVVLSKAQKHVPYGESVGATECITL